MTLNRWLGSLFAVLLTAGACASMAATEPPPAAYTLGDLVMRLIEEMGVAEAQQGPEAGRAFLAAAGIEVEGDLGRGLDEAETVAIFNQLGANVTTSNPEARIDAQTIERLLALTLPDGLSRVQAEGCHGGAGCDPLAWLKLFCRKHPNLCKDIASRCGH